MAAGLLGAGTAFGWGEQGHTIVNVAASQLMESDAAAFFQANSKNLGVLATTPDIMWKQSATYSQEAPYHFFQWDNYSTSSLGPTIDQVVFSKLVATLGASYVKTNGASVWRIDQIYVKLVNALKSGDWVTALQMAGTLGHYVGDLSQPMHDTADYDGQSIGRSGIHAYFETTLVKKMNQSQLQDTVTNAGGPLRQAIDQQYASSQESGDQLIRTVVVDEGKAAYAELQDVLADFDPNGGQDDKALEGFFGPRMGAGAATLAKVWDLAVAESGASGFPTDALTVEQPDWFALTDPNQ